MDLANCEVFYSFDKTAFYRFFRNSSEHFYEQMGN